jgi:hypothetical protein
MLSTTIRPKRSEMNVQCSCKPDNIILNLHFFDCFQAYYNSRNQSFTVKSMPTFIHDSHQAWLGVETTLMLASGFLMLAEKLALAECLAGTSKSYLSSPKFCFTNPNSIQRLFKCLRRVPERAGCLHPPPWRKVSDYSNIVIESGWTQTLG